MAYKFLLAESPIRKSPKEEYIGFFQQTVNEQFYNASDWFTVEEETAYGSGKYENVDVRINHVVDTQTGERVGDDFRKLMFKDINHATTLGKMFRFAQNYWITVNVEAINSLMATVVVKRCNNVLRWVDELTGAYQALPCSIGYLIKENRDYSTAGSSLVVPSGMIEVQVQLNDAANTIRPNQRFLFGNSNNWIAYRVEGGGMRNFNNTRTLDNRSGGILLLSMVVDYSNDHADDLANGIADGNQFIYELELSQSSISGSASQSVQLDAVLKLNGETVNRPLTWSSDNQQVATVDSDGLVTFIASGNAIITCSISNNDNVADTCDVVVSSTPFDNYQIVIAPFVNYVYENDEQEWEVYLYKNESQQADTMSFSLNPNTIPDTNYIYTVTGTNTFKIKNFERYLTDVLEVTATSGSHSKVFSVSLKGAF